MGVFKFLVIQSVVVILSSLLAWHISQYGHQPTAYMDEIFHIPQAQKYCNGSFEEWDPKITTLPGLYLFSIGLLKPFQQILSITNRELCSVLNLRLINTLFCAGNFYLFVVITETLNKKNQQENYTLLKALTLSLMPLLFFFNFLFYTDSGSLFFILYAYYYHLKGSYSAAAILGMISMIFRQTNIVWVFFMSLCNVSRILYKQMRLESRETHTVCFLLTHSLPVFVINTVISCWSYGIVGVTAIAFVLWNGSVVVGDKSAHEASFNPPQLGYFALFTLGLSLMHLVTVTKIKQFLNNICSNAFVYMVAIATSTLLIYQFTQVHPYLLADNRHYTFYFWSKLYARFTWSRYILLPVYLFSLWSINHSLSHIHSMIRGCLWVCICAALVPQKLIEFRYFVVPYMLIRLHMKGETTRSLLLELTLYILINSFTLHRFLYKPIFWPNVEEPQRIMW